MSNHTINFGFEHKAGILMPVSSLPSKYGIGSFGKEAFEFIDFLDAADQKCWQVLPLNPTSYGDSPYQSPASAAGNPYFIDLEKLYEKGLLTEEELEAQREDSRLINYGWLFGARYTALRIAHSRFTPDSEYGKFMIDNMNWIDDYALFMALKVKNNYCQWTLWDDEYKDYRRAVLHKDELSEEMSFWRWVQYEFMTQWSAVVDYAHSKGITIIGDMPIYVAHDSMDVWASPEQFLLDENYNPTVVAGCPPDGYAPDGQLWGNPIYNWELMEKQNFQWWIGRVGSAFKLYDILRIDHFRGFAGYYNIPYGEPTAKNGKWDSAPGTLLFKAIKNRYPEAKIIAEDLGLITEDVRELLEDTGFPGMKMLQFGVYDDDSEYLPRMFTTKNCVVYTSTHDSDCTVSWLEGLDDEANERLVNEFKEEKEAVDTYDVIELALESIANLAVIPMQDYLELTNEEGRMNTPSTASGNWGWRMSADYNTEELLARIKDVTKRTDRSK